VNKTGKGPLGQVGVSFINKKDEPPLFAKILLITVFILFIWYVFYDISHQPIRHYQVTTYNLDGSKTINITNSYEINELSGTYSYYTKNQLFIKVPIKNTIIEELLNEQK
jgi:uncharacterized membrane-anchored protein YitT (DUF2179 family)